MVQTAFTQQSASLHSTYYLVQTLIYRLFIPSPISSPDLSRDFPFPAREICIHATKACAAIVAREMQSELCYVPLVTHTSQVCAGLLLMDIWNLKAQEKAVASDQVEDTKPSLAQEIKDLTGDVFFFMRALEWAEPRWGDAARAL